MSLQDKSEECLVAAREAVARGDFKVGKKMSTMSISYNPSIEGYYLRAEANYLAGEFDEACENIEQARALCTTDEEEETWSERLEQCYVRASELDEDDDGPPVSELISVMVPVLLKNKGKAWTKISDNPDLSTDGITLMRIGNSVIYDVEFLEFSPDWVDVIIDSITIPIEPELIKDVRKTANFLHVFGPNVEIEQTITSQVDLAIQVVQMLEPLVRSLEAPVAFLRGSNNVVDYKTIRSVCDDINLVTLIDFYVKKMNAGDCLFSVGMHQFGFEDVEVPFSVVPLEEAIDLLNDFLLFQLENNFSDAPDVIEYQSGSTIYSLKRKEEVRFNIEGEARHNLKGIWHVVGVLEE